ncbi:MAG: hypothetical protein JW751_20590 [Polyangiaceae bacterium]|nr:hypothetical protein [Polyangiaceae bacterium]
MLVRSRGSRHAFDAVVGSLLLALAIVVVSPLRSAPWFGAAEIAARIEPRSVASESRRQVCPSKRRSLDHRDRTNPPRTGYGPGVSVQQEVQQRPRTPLLPPATPRYLSHRELLR